MIFDLEYKVGWGTELVSDGKQVLELMYKERFTWGENSLVAEHGCALLAKVFYSRALNVKVGVNELGRAGTCIAGWNTALSYPTLSGRIVGRTGEAACLVDQ